VKNLLRTLLVVVAFATTSSMQRTPNSVSCSWGTDQLADGTYRLNDQICQYCNGGHWDNKQCDDCVAHSARKAQTKALTNLDCTDMKDSQSGLTFSNGAWKIYDGKYYICGSGVWLQQDPLPQSICKTKPHRAPKPS
jgi:hypothetical protein